MSFNQQFSLNIQPETKRKSLASHKKIPKWLKFYQPKANLNNPQYHFVSQPQRQKHQIVVIKKSQFSRPMTMYFQIEDKQSLSHYYMHLHRQDKSKLKTFQHLNNIEPEDQILFNKDQAVRDSMWAKKYQPKAFYQLLTEQIHNRNVLTWLKSWDWIVFRKQVATITPTVKFSKNKINTQLSKFPQTTTNQYNHNKLILLSGPPGCGKTTLARVLARHCGYEIMQLNASDDRSGKALIQKIESLGRNNSVINGKPTMIIVDQVDGALQQDGNGIKQVLNYIQSGGKNNQKHHKQNIPKPTDLAKRQNVHNQKHTLIPRPIIFICNDPYVKGLKQLRAKAIVVYFRQVQKEKIIKRLKEITQQESVYIENEVLMRIAEITNCDIRSSLSILQYVCNAKKVNNQNPKGNQSIIYIDIVTKLRVSFQKDSNTSINEFVSSLLNETRSSTSLKNSINLKQLSYTISKIDSQSLLMQMFYHNFIQYKYFFNRKTKKCVKFYQQLSYNDILTHQSFKYGGQTDIYLMMIFLYYKIHIHNDEYRKVQFPAAFFQRLNKQKQNKQVVNQLADKWPPFLRSTVSLNTVIKEYIWILYYAVQTNSTKDSDIIDCVGKMITYGIEFASKNSGHLFKPEFDSLLMYDDRKPQILYTMTSRNFIEESYEFAKLKSHLLSDISLSDLNKNTEELMSQLNIKNRKRKRNPQQMGKNSIKYKYIQGSGTQITYDLKFKYFFQ